MLSKIVGNAGYVYLWPCVELAPIASLIFLFFEIMMWESPKWGHCLGAERLLTG